MQNQFSDLNKRIISCRQCDRLIAFRKKIVKNKRKKYIDQIYWAKPITGFGDINAKILFVGLAPAAHGGTRTGRVFTGDKSSDFLYKCLYNAKISNQSKSEHVNDGLKLKDAYITAALKCVPPEDKPIKSELYNCFKYFNTELILLKNLKIIVGLGKIAFDTCVEFYKKNYGIRGNYKFAHGKFFKLTNKIILVGCYHPSPRNVNTGRINERKMTNLFKRIKEIY